MENTLNVTASIVTYNDSNRVIDTCLSIKKYTKKYPLKLFVIDNASADNTAELVENGGYATVIRQESNLGFGAAHNTVLDYELGKYHFFINPDITFNSDVISKMVDFFEEHTDVVMAMPRILNVDGSEQKLPKEKPSFKNLFLGRLLKKVRDKYIWQDREITEPCEINFCSGCFFCIRQDVLRKIGGFDKRYFMYLEDADMCLSAKKYGKTMFLPQFNVTHAWERESAKSIKYLIIHIISCIKFLFKWRGLRL